MGVVWWSLYVPVSFFVGSVGVAGGRVYLSYMHVCDIVWLTKYDKNVFVCVQCLTFSLPFISSFFLSFSPSLSLSLLPPLSSPSLPSLSLPSLSLPLSSLLHSRGSDKKTQHSGQEEKRPFLEQDSIMIIPSVAGKLQQLIRLPPLTDIHEWLATNCKWDKEKGRRERERERERERRLLPLSNF